MFSANLRARTRSSTGMAVEPMEPRTLFAAISPTIDGVDLVAPNDATTVVADRGVAASDALVGAWRGSFVDATGRKVSMTMLVEEVHADGGFVAAITLKTDMGKEVSAVGSGGILKRGITVQWQVRKSFTGRLEGRIYPGKAIEAAVDMTVDGLRSAGVTTLEFAPSATLARGGTIVDATQSMFDELLA